MSFPRTMLFRALDAREFESQIVAHEGDLLIAKGQGWCESPKEAFDLLEKHHEDLGQAAAHRAHDDKHLSAAAQREAEAYEKTTSKHVAEVPEQVKAPRGRKVKP